MISRADCHLTGRWRIIKADFWDRDYLDLIEPAPSPGQPKRMGRIHLRRPHRRRSDRILPNQCVFARTGFDESGEAAAEPNDDGTLTSSYLSTTAAMPTSSHAAPHQAIVSTGGLG